MPKIISDFINRNFGETWLGRLGNRLFSWVELLLMRPCKDRAVLKMIKDLRQEGRPLFKPSEIFHIYSIARACAKLFGDFAEVGVYNGTSAKIICEVKGDKNLYLFDTFFGLPEVNKDDNRFHKNMYAASYEGVRQRLQKYPHVKIYQGIFPGTADPIKDKKFAFVHLDVDVYTSTKAALAFFYDRMVGGGIILTHDYAQAEGVRRAFDEFLADKPEGIIELSLTQAFIIKLCAKY
ncbi:class I SAM-dependent methyltransferase [Candidatus Falkowbacteria bacterium]|nr:class I SAM-dependent methyltransferase [Candidatus Falkowbacteria bacterium]